MADPIEAVFHRPFPEQVAAFRARLGHLVPTARWDDIWQESHDKAFMVAGATKADLLADLAGAVDTAISEGRGIEAFRRDFRQIVETHGWHGWTGEDTAAGQAWRTRVIYRTNARTTYNAGRFAQLTEGKFAYWIYRHGGSLEPRLQHLGWNGLMLPPDHPFWQTHYTPNGWGCSCYVIGARSIAGARRRGGNPAVKLGDDWQVPNAKTGAPDGIDRGWAYAPGRSSVETILSLRGKLDQLPERPSIDLIQSWLSTSGFATWLKNPTGTWPLVRISADDAAKIGAQKQVADLSSESALKQLQQHPELTTADYALAQKTVSEATHTIVDGTRSLIFVREAEDGHVLVVKATQTGQGLFVTSYRRLSRKQVKRDQELQRLLNKG